MTDTSAETQARDDQLLTALTPAERLERALALSSFARQLAWAGAERFAGHLGRADVIERFFLQCMVRQYWSHRCCLNGRMATRVSRDETRRVIANAPSRTAQTAQAVTNMNRSSGAIYQACP